MITPVFYSSLENKQVDASIDHFAKFPMKFGSGFSIVARQDLLTAGNPKYTLMGCNFNGSQSDFVELGAATTNMTMGQIYSTNYFNYAYLGIRYDRDTATGYVQLYLNVAD